MNEEEKIWNFKADGAIGGGIAFAIIGDHENRPTDMTNLVVIDELHKLGRKADISNLDIKECRGGAEDARQREF